MARRITILGMGPSANERRWDIARYCDGTEIWGLNNGFMSFPLLRDERAFDRWYELHAWNYLRTYEAATLPGGLKIDYWAEINQLGCTVYAGQPLPLVANQTAFPWDDVFRHFGLPVYFLGSPSIMLAHALWEHDQGQTIEYIQSWGIDTSDPAHGQQRASWAFWIARAIERGIKLGGTSCDFMKEHERDDGLRGLREIVAGKIENNRRKGAVDDYLVCSFCTPTEPYQSGMARLAEQCRELGLGFDGVTTEVPEEIREDSHARRAWIVRQKPATILAMLEKHDRPVLWVDADDELIARPSFPECDFGWFKNPELEVLDWSHLQICSFGYAAPTPAGKKWMQQWAQFCNVTNDHRAIQMTWTMLYTRANIHGRYVDVTRHIAGCLKFNPSPDGHRKQTLYF